MCLSLGCVRLFATHELELARLLCPWDSPDKNIGMGCHSLLQGIFPTQGLNSGLLHCRQIPHHLSHWRSPNVSIIHDYLTRLMGRLKIVISVEMVSATQNGAKAKCLIRHCLDNLQEGKGGNPGKWFESGRCQTPMGS